MSGTELVEVNTGEAAGSIEDLIDDNGWLPGDEEYEAPVVVEAAAEEEEEEESDADDPDGEESEEVAEEDDSEETDEEEPEEPEEGKTEDISDDTLVEIQIGEDVYEVNFAELRAGYLRNEDYANKVVAHEAEYDSKLAALETREAELAEELRLASVMVTGDLNAYEQINWVGLKAADPAKYQELRVEYVEAKERAAAVEARRQNINAMHSKAQELRHQAYLKGQMALADSIVPGWREPKFLEDLVAFGKSVGHTEEEIRGISDARHLLVLNQAKLYAESQVRRKEAMDKKVTTKLPPVNKPGAVKEKTSTDRQVVKNAKAAFQRDKSVESAAALLMNFDL
jgi:hypothetical protein